MKCGQRREGVQKGHFFADVLIECSLSDFDLVYEIVNSPSHGHLVFAENITLPIKRFTQADVNRKRVIYFHSSGSGGQRSRGGGGSRLKPDDFYFKVSDGQHDPVYRHFRIHIIPLELNLANLTAIQIQQVSKFWSQCCVYNVGIVYVVQYMNVLNICGI